MPMFNPQTEYDILRKDFPIRDFFDYAEEFVVRPPYQRKNVWTRGKQQDLLDSLFRRYYVPRIVIREVRLDSDQSVYEVIDGQQRINTAQRFLSDKLRLPTSLEDIDPRLPRSHYSDLPVDIRRFVDRDLVYNADVVKGIDNPADKAHQEVATEIFWRLQQGETLTYMEIAHSRLSSLARNFVVKYADDQRFDYETYKPIAGNDDKHRFFTIIDRKNNRMQHLALLTRFLILEENDGPADIKETSVKDYIDQYQRPNGIANWTLEDEPFAQTVLRTMSSFYEIFKDDPVVTDTNGMKELKTEYFIISTYLLLRHLLKYYVFDAAEQKLFYDFVIEFHQRWKDKKEDDQDILIFSDNRQQTSSEIRARDRIIRQGFFEYAISKNHAIVTKDDRRRFSEAERISIYRRDNGLCQICLDEGKPEKEAFVPWDQYEADHVIPHSKGGSTDGTNAQVLCQYHNRQKGARI